MKKYIAWLLALLMLLSSTLALAEETSLTVGTTTAMSGSFMNGMFGSNTADIDVSYLLHGYSLTTWDELKGNYVFDGTVVKSVAEKMVDGSVVYTLELDPDLKYSDGTPITASDYAFSILLANSPEAAALGAAPADYILGSEAYRTGAAEALYGVYATGEHTLIVALESRFDPYYYELGLLSVNPYPISVIAPGCEVISGIKGSYIKGDFTAEVLAKTLLDPATGYLSNPSVVSGPYTLVNYDAEASVATFKANDYYLGNAGGKKATIENITYMLVDNAEIASLLNSGELDLVNKLTKASTIDAALATAGTASTDYGRSGLSMVSFACEQPTVASAAVRQAIAHCFDKAAFAESYVGKYGETVDGYYGIGQWMYERTGISGLATYALDIAAAAELLANDGWAPNADGIREKDGVALELTLIYPAGNEVGEFLSGAFANALAQVGIKLTAEALPFAELLKVYYRQTERDVDMIYLATNFGVVYDPSVTFDPADAAQGVNNRSGIADAELYQLALEMSQTKPGDTAGYCAKWQAFQQRWSEVLPAIPVYSNTYYDVYTTGLNGYDITAAQTWSQAILGATIK